MQHLRQKGNLHSLAEEKIKHPLSRLLQDDWKTSNQFHQAEAKANLGAHHVRVSTVF
jgi:hypothetical protein